MIMSLEKNFLIQWWENKKENQTKDQSMKKLSKIKRKTDRLRSMKNLLIQWELRKKTDPKFEPLG